VTVIVRNGKSRLGKLVSAVRRYIGKRVGSGFAVCLTVGAVYVSAQRFHAIMIGSLPVFLAGGIGVFVLDAIQVINPVLILLIVGYFARRRAMPAP